MLLDGVFGHAFPRDAAEVFWGSLSDMITTFPRDAATPLWKKKQKTKMDDWPETSSQFRGRFRAQICAKNDK